MENNLKNLTIEEKVGQMIMIDFPGFELESSVRKRLQQIPWGGVILFARNIRDRKQLIDLNQDLMSLHTKLPFYISVDQEGGLVNRADFPDMHLSPGAMALGKEGDEELAEKVSFISGIELRELGFHLDYAPDVDVNVNPENPIIGVRSFGEDPELVGKMGAASIRGFEKAGIASCAKHFPGHGDTSFDSHLSLASVEADRSRIDKVEIPPFKAAIEAGVPAIMTAHVVFPAIDGENRIPATLSKKVLTDLLRNEMGFKGLIITDAMSMKAIADNYGTAEAAVMAINAGADIVMMCGSSDEQIAAYRAVLKAVTDKIIPMKTVDSAVERILGFKKKYVAEPVPLPSLRLEERESVINEAAKRSVKILYNPENVIPLNPENRKAMVLSPDKLYKTLLDESAEQWSIFPLIGEKFAKVEKATYDPSNPDKKVFMEAARGDYNVIFIEVYSRGAVGAVVNEAVSEAAAEAGKRNIPVVLISLSSSYGLFENAGAAITAYNYLPESLRAITERIFA